MYLLLTILIILLVLTITVLVLMAVFPVKIAFTYDSEQLKEYRLLFSWLRPILKGSLIKDDNTVMLKAYVLGLKVVEKSFESKISNRNDALNMIREIHPHLIKLETFYGFEDPSITGIVCGSINIISQYVEVDDMDNHPDFNTDYDYFNAYATAKINALNSLRVMLRNRNKVSGMQPQY